MYAGGNRPGFGDNAKLIDDEKDLKGEFEDLTKEDLKERLFVAEKVMKSLFQRNKELEEKEEERQAAMTSDNYHTKPSTRPSESGKENGNDAQSESHPFEQVDSATGQKQQCKRCVTTQEEAKTKEQELTEQIEEL